MYNSEDLERIYFQDKTETLPLGMSIDSFSQRTIDNDYRKGYEL